jgi:hypothetical protein
MAIKDSIKMVWGHHGDDKANFKGFSHKIALMS